MSKSREEVDHYLKKVLGFVRVRTLTPGRRLYAHLVPGTKGLWIPIELERGEKSITDFVMQQVRHLPPNPRPIPKNFRIRKVNKKLVIEEIPKPKATKEKPRAKKEIELSESKIPIEQLRREYNEHRNISRKLVKGAINKITKDERNIQKLTRSIIGKLIRKNAMERQAARNRLPAPRTERPYAGPRVRTSARNMYEHKIPRTIESSTYKRLRGEGLSERQARALINVFGYDDEPTKKEENLANYLEHWERESLKYGPREEYGGGVTRSEPEPFRRLYGSSKQIPVQTRRKHRPDYKLYSTYR